MFCNSELLEKLHEFAESHGLFIVDSGYFELDSVEDMFAADEITLVISEDDPCIEISGGDEIEFLKAFDELEDPVASLLDEARPYFPEDMGDNEFLDELWRADDASAFLWQFNLEYSEEHIRMVLASREVIAEARQLVQDTITFRNKYERDIILNSPNGGALYQLSTENNVPITAELEDMTHLIGDPAFLPYVVGLYKENPVFLNAAVNGVLPEGISGLEEVESVSPDDYRSDLYEMLAAEFKKQYNFVPAVLPQIEQGLMNLYGGEISYNDGRMTNSCPITEAQLSDFVANFDRKSVSAVRGTFNSTLIALCAMGKIKPSSLSKEQVGILAAYMHGTDAKNLYKTSEVLNRPLNGAKLADYEAVVKHPAVAAEYLQKVNGGHTVTISELSQEIQNNWMQSEQHRYEQKYKFAFATNRVDIPGADKVVSMNGLKAYILPADDLRNFTVGYDTACCQHFGGAGENCVTAAVTRPNAGIFVIEKDGKIEAQAFVWAHKMQSRDGSFVFDSLAFDNIEFANDQNLNRHADVIAGYKNGMTQDVYRACKNTMDFEGILAAYVKELPIQNVYMGTGYNVMTSIGEKFTDKYVRTADDIDHGYTLSGCAANMASEAIGGNTYTDFDEAARVLKLHGEMLMTPQMEMTPAPDSKMIACGEKAYSTSVQDMKNSAVLDFSELKAVVGKDKNDEFACTLMHDNDTIGTYSHTVAAASVLIAQAPCGRLGWDWDSAVRVDTSFSGMPIRQLEVAADSGLDSILSGVVNKCPELESVVAPGVKEIGFGAFASDKRLSRVEFPDVEKIGQWAFQGDKSLKSVSFPECKDLSAIDIFSDTGLEVAYLPKLEHIDAQAFGSNSSPSNLKLLYVGPNLPQSEIDALKQSPVFQNDLLVIRLEGREKTHEAPEPERNDTHEQMAEASVHRPRSLDDIIANATSRAGKAPAKTTSRELEH